MTEKPSPKTKTEIGKVTSTKMQKTITVVVERLVRHPRYGKYVRRRTKLYAHDEREEAREGDVVEVAFSRPLSRLKRWRLVRIVKRAPEVLAAEGKAAEGEPS